MGKHPYKINLSDEHQHMVRVYMVHNRLPSMTIAIARMIEKIMQDENPHNYTYKPSER